MADKRVAGSAQWRSRLRVEIHGAVQGVGFRPYVYRLATDLGLAGWVMNDTQGVFIEVEGPEPDVRQFAERLPAEVPPRALIQMLTMTWLLPTGYRDFEIRPSNDSGAKTALVLPDIATCPDCLAELFDPANRRYRYPFTNCTNCGPRFTIIEALPYDRPNTTMRRFTLCPTCKVEYEDPLDRRFHAQPNACPACGPRLTFYERRHAEDATPEFKATAWADDALRHTAAALREGRIVAVKGLGGFHLMVDARNDAAIRRLRQSKPRRAKPFALMARDPAQVRQFCEVTAEAEALLMSAEAPIVLLKKIPRIKDPDAGGEDQEAESRKPEAVTPSLIPHPASFVSPEVAPDNPSLGVMLPYTPLHHLLLRELDFPVVATSGNLADEPICTDEAEALQRLGHIADAFLVHDRPIARHADDSVAWIVAGAPRLLRRARGYAPLPVGLKEPAPTILAVGAHLKNTVALNVGRQVFISQHIGDLETPEAMAAFERVIADFLRLYEATPVAIAHDLHPDYLSTRWAQEDHGLPGVERRIPVQHHHAHLAACLAENQVEGPALGVTWDGTGYGPDGTIWGGEFLLGDATGYARVAHLRPFRLPGGEAAVREPRRVALALLWELCGEAALEMNALAMDDLAPIRDLRPAGRTLLAQMLARGINAPLTTSAGRLFDGIAALIGLPDVISFEGQAAMALEFAADPQETGVYEVGWETSSVQRPTSDEMFDVSRSTFDVSRAPYILDWAPLVSGVLADLRHGTPQSIIAARYHNTLIEAIVAVAQRVGMTRVALSGGCFQNRLLTERAAARLEAVGFRVLLHRQVPPNDGGISLGQVAVAATRVGEGTAFAYPAVPSPGR